MSYSTTPDKECMFWVPSFVFACLSLCVHGYFKKTNKIILMIMLSDYDS